MAYPFAPHFRVMRVGWAGLFRLIFAQFKEATARFRLFSESNSRAVFQVARIIRIRCRCSNFFAQIGRLFERQGANEFHGCAGKGFSVEPARGNAASERLAREFPNVRRHVVPIETPDGVRKCPAYCGAIFDGEILSRAIVQFPARGIEG